MPFTHAPRRAGAVRADAAVGRWSAPALEALEPRALLSAFTVQDASEAFDLGQFVRDIAPPAGAAAFGSAVAGLGDINGDGADDFAVSAPGADSVGSVYIYSGRDRSSIRTLSDGAIGFGTALLGIADVNADGFGDLLVGSPFFDGNDDAVPDRHGRVWVYSGADGAVIRTLDGEGRFDELGFALAFAGDADGDGVPDVLIGAPGAGGTGEPGPGAAYIRTGDDFSLFRTFTGENVGDRFGHAVGGGVDTPLDSITPGDGLPEVIIGAPGSDAAGVDAGRAYVFDGATGQARFTFTGEHAGDRFGTAVEISRISRDIVAPSLLRYFIGAPGADNDFFGVDAGRLYRFDATGGSDSSSPLLFGAEAGALFGSRLTLLHGLTYSDQTTIAVSAPGAAATPRIALIRTTGFAPATELGFVDRGSSVLAPVGDTDGDGIPDLFAARPEGQGAEAAAQLVPTALTASLPALTAISDNGRFAILAPYVYRDGVVQSIASLPGLLPGDTLQGVNDVGLFFGEVPRPPAADPSERATPDQQFFYFQGQRVTLASAIRQTVGVAPATVRFIAMSNPGDVIFNGLSQVSGPSIPEYSERAYLFRAGTLRELWQGSVYAVNDAGVVVGEGTLSPPDASTYLRFDAAGRISSIPGLQTPTLAHSFFVYRSLGINDAGDIVGNGPDTTLTLVDGASGAATALSGPASIPGGSTPVFWSVQDVDEDGRMLAIYSYLRPGPIFRPPTGAFAAGFLFTPGVGLERLADIAVGTPFFAIGGTRARFLDDGRIAYGEQILVPAEETPADATAAVGSPTSTIVIGDTTYIAAINTAGEAVVLRRSGARWQDQLLMVHTADVRDVVLYADPRDGRAYAVVRTATGLTWFRPRADGLFEAGVWLARHDDELPAGHLTTFVSRDDRVHLVGRTADGDVVIYYQSGAAATDAVENWAFNNLSRDHVEAQGLASPEFTGDLVAFSTGWNGMNIVGVDAGGDIQTIWWAPGMTLWSVDNLSESAGTPTVSGPVAAFVTPWDTLHIAAATADGHVAVTWWAPGFGGQWMFNDLTAEIGGLPLAATPASYVTDWAGLTIVGTDQATGLAAVYWWAPDTNRWASEILQFPAATAGPKPAGPVTAAAGAQSQTIVFRTADNHIRRVFWRVGDGGVWHAEDVTQLLA